MLKNNNGLLIGFLFLVFSSFVNAEKKQYYFGISIGEASPSIFGLDVTENRNYVFQDINTLGLTIAYKVDQNLFVEGGLIKNLQSGDVLDDRDGIPTKWDVTALLLNGVYRGSGAFHIRLKAGLNYVKIDDSDLYDANPWAPENNSVNLSYGLGFGFDSSSGKEFVVEFNKLTNDISILNFGLNF